MEGSFYTSNSFWSHQNKIKMSGFKNKFNISNVLTWSRPCLCPNPQSQVFSMQLVIYVWLAVCPSHGSLAPFLVKPSVIRETCQNRQNPLSTEGTVGCARLQTRFLLVTGGWPWRLSIYRLCAECLTDTDAAKHNPEQTTLIPRREILENNNNYYTFIYNAV